MTTIPKKFYTFIITLSIIMLGHWSAQATHIAGGQFSYQCMGVNGNNITLELYLDFRRDCFNAQPGAVFDNPARIAIYSSNGILLNELGNNGTLDFFTNDIDTLTSLQTSECQVLGDDVCVETTRYVHTVTLPYREDGYIFAYQRCCRNITLTNIVSPNDQGTTQTIELTGEAQLSCNSSPQFNAWPPVYVCAGKDFVFDHSAVDVEGDQLVYSLCTPFVGGAMNNPAPFPASAPPYAEINWSSGYDLETLIGPTVNPLTIDSMSGEITAMPNTIGQYLVGICVEEYRDGQLLSKTYRDFELNVRLCLEDTEEYVEEYKCPGDTIIIDNEPITESGEYVFVYETVDGCDSTVFLTVLNFEDEESVLQTSICEGESVIVNGVEYLTAGTYFQEFETVEGCDSLVVIEINADFNCDDCQPRPGDDMNIAINKRHDELYEIDIQGIKIQLTEQQLSVFINQAEYYAQKNDRTSFNQLMKAMDLKSNVDQLLKSKQSPVSKSYQFVTEARKGTAMNISFKFHKP